MVAWTRINAIGAVTISSLTIVGAVYLFYSLVHQGRGKLRVRLLIGTVISDVVVGLVALPPETMYLAGRPLVTGSHACDGFGFVFTATLFSQHLWTLAIALATFLLLKHPLHPWTTALERWSWVAWPVIWGISILHSIIWYVTVGFVSSGNLCYYGSKSAIPGLDRDLVQFIPRCFVFVVIVVLYSSLFNFLRRPDTIQLSTQFMSGSATGGQTPEIPRVLRPLARFRLGSRDTQGAPKPDPDAPPWEQVEFMNPNIPWMLSSMNEETGGTSTSFIRSSPSQFTLPPFPGSGSGTTTPKRGSSSTNPGSGHGSDSILLTGHNSHRSSETETVIASESSYHHHLRYDDTEKSQLGSTGVVDLPARPPLYTPRVHTPALSLVLSESAENPAESRAEDNMFGTERVTVEDGDEREIGDEDSGPSLKEFFLQNQISSQVRADQTGSGHDARGAPQMSATAYFNRQASLLMLYFPLAYMFVFSVSLVRLCYDMVHHSTNSVLSLISAWMVLSVGLIDAFVFGIAELIVRQRVRRKMPDRIG